MLFFFLRVQSLMFVFISILGLNFAIYTSSEPRGDTKNYTITVNASTTINYLEHFWKSTGFCPPDPHEEFYKYMSTNDMAQNIIYIGAVPNQGIQQVRIHFLLDLISMHLDVKGEMVLNYTKLDQALDLLVHNGLRPGFELMGNPSGYFTDFDDIKQIYDWMEMITQLGVHLIDRYGLGEVYQWNFESWNEPFSRIAFVGLKVSLQGYLNYYDACVEGLNRAHGLKIGGPATGNPLYHQKSSHIFYTFLDHCHNGVNFFTGKKGVQLDFISFHIKGEGYSSKIVETEKIVLDQIKSKFPKFANIPIYNDEADPLVGWNKAEEWRADARYAAVVVKIIAQHQNILIPNYPQYKLLSNDNGFMNYPPSYFSQRTLLARFQMNTSHPRKVEFIQKPVLGAMALLGLMGDKQISAEVQQRDGKRLFKVKPYDDLGVLASSTSDYLWQCSILIYNSNDTSNVTGTSMVNVIVNGLPMEGDIFYVIYQIDDNHGNAYAVWKHMGSPVFPSEDQLEQLRLHQEPVRTVGPRPLDVKGGTSTLTLELPLPGLALLHFCLKHAATPSQVANVATLRVSSNEVLVYWKHEKARCIKTYKVLSSNKEKGSYVVVSKFDFIFLAFHHVLLTDQEKVDGGHVNELWYKVHAVDYWGRQGKDSEPVPVKMVENT